LEAATITQHIANILQSEESLQMSDLQNITVGVVTPLVLEGRLPSTARNMFGQNFLKMKKSCVLISNIDSLCLPRAICVAWAAAHKCPDDPAFRRLRSQYPQRESFAEVCFEMGCVSESFYHKVTNGNRAPQKKMAVLLCHKAGIDLARPLSIDMIGRFEDILNCNIRLVSHKDGDRLVKAPIKFQNAKTLYLYLTDDDPERPVHVDSIISMSGFLNPADVCQECPVPHPSDRPCVAHCRICMKADCVATGTVHTCDKCNAYCNSSTCLETHAQAQVKGRKSTCERLWHCPKCRMVVTRASRSPTDHECFEKRCNVCNVYYVDDHQCYMRNTTATKRISKLLFYDVETTQTTTHQCKYGHLPRALNGVCANCHDTTCGSLRHVAVLIVCHSVCEHCRADRILAKCAHCGTRCETCDTWLKQKRCYVKKTFCDDVTCGRREVYFEGESAAHDFTCWLFGNCHNGYTTLAHNAGGFDSYIVLEQMQLNGTKPTKIFYNGSKVLYFETKLPIKMRFLDSIAFLPMALSALPAAFELDELSKGFFPYLFVRLDNLDYKGAMPGEEFFSPGTMTLQKKAEFTTWYSAHKDVREYSLRAEMLRYCISDVNILREACLVFQNLMIEATTCDPFSCISIASIAMRVYRTMYARESYTIVTPDKRVLEGRKLGAAAIEIYDENRWITKTDYRDFEACKVRFREADMALTTPSGIAGSNINHSAESIAWLEWEAHSRNIYIQHARNKGEKVLPGGVYVDGYDERSGTVFDYQGCFIHGHSCIDSNRDRVVFGNKSADRRALDTVRYVAKLRKSHTVVVMHACTWATLCKEPAIEVFVKGLNVPKRLATRDAFFGGRTELFWLYRQVVLPQKIRYLDVCSLYPSRQKVERFPLGHPEIVLKPVDCDIEVFFGYAVVRVLPPRRLLIPVLPMKIDGKLLFHLCNKCGTTHSKEPCVCTDAERSWIACYGTPEIAYALTHGYKVLEIYEVYHWNKTSQYSRDGTEVGLFSQFVNGFLRMKQEASGYPSTVQTDAEKAHYIESYREQEGIDLDPTKIKKRPALRSIAKMLLNSLWGKFSQRDLPRTDVFGANEEAKVINLMADPSREIMDFFIPTDDMIVMKSRRLYESATPLVQARNLYVAAFVTMYGRIHLHKIMTSIGHARILYCDTDSVIFTQRPDEYDPPLGEFLGCLTDELEPGDHITEFCSNLPKSYAYRTHKGRSTVKVKGFTLNYANSRRITLETLVDMVKNNRPSLSTEIQPKIVRNRERSVLLTIPQGKCFRTVYDKRVVCSTYDTKPYGY